jgi:hypothetical protein
MVIAGDSHLFFAGAKAGLVREFDIDERLYIGDVGFITNL